MKKVLFMLFCCTILCGCSIDKNRDVVKEFINKVESLNSYSLKGTMEIYNNEDSYTYKLEAIYLKDDLYKVKLVNITSEHEQIIIKDDENVYVITPAINKSFKFQSEWPYNSSQAYLVNVIADDIKSDKEASFEQYDKGYVIKSKVNYPNNGELSYQKVYINKDNIINKVEVYNNDNIVKIKCEFEEVKYNPTIKPDEFEIEDYMTGNECEEGECEEKEQKTASIDSAIYPLYIPSDTYLASSEKIDTDNGNRIILTFSGKKNFVLIEEASKTSSEMEIIPVYGDPLMLDETVGAISASSISFDASGISYYIASNDLTIEEMKLVANSLGNLNLVSNIK